MPTADFPPPKSKFTFQSPLTRWRRYIPDFQIIWKLREGLARGPVGGWGWFGDFAGTNHFIVPRTRSTRGPCAFRRGASLGVPLLDTGRLAIGTASSETSA